MKQRKTFFWVGGMFLIVFFLFSILVATNTLTPFDYQATSWIQHRFSTRLDTFFSVFSLLGTIDVTSVFLVILLYFCRNKNGLYILSSFGIILCFELFSKYFISHPAPPEMFARYQTLVVYPSAYLPQPPSSYPSGHAARTLFLSGIILTFLFRSKKWKPWIRWTITLFILLYDATMLVTRIDLGEHWTTDVIGGSLLGIGLVCINAGLIRVGAKNKKQKIK